MTGHALPSKLADEVACRVGLSVPASRKGSVASAIARIMARRGIDDSSLLLLRLGLDQDLADDVIAAVTVGETHFFRDPEQFQLIRQEILPELTRRTDGGPTRIWSVGCATGEEPYSLAILCDEEGLSEEVRICAVDISGRALGTARAAEYGEWSLRNTDSKLKERYFTACEDRFRLNDRLRRQVDFAVLNLGEADLPAPERGLADFGLILCRNVLVYLDASKVRRIARQLFACLADGGWLLTAPTDPPLWKYAPFETGITPAGVVYRRMMVHRGVRKSPTSGIVSAQGQPKKPVTRTAAAQACVTDAQKAPGDQASRAIARNIRSRYDMGETREAACLAAQAIESYPLSAELHFLQGLSQLADGETDAAAAALRRVVYLDSTLSAAQFFLGICLQHSDPEASLRALENVLQSCLSRPPQERVSLMANATAGDLVERARREIGKIRRRLGSGSR